MDCDKSYFQLFSLDAALGYTIMGCLLFSFCPVIAYRTDSFPAYQMSDDLSLKNYA